MSAEIGSLSTKRECWIAVGKHRIRIPADLHSDLTRFSDSRRYGRHFDALLYAASVGLKVLATAESLNVISVTKRD